LFISGKELKSLPPNVRNIQKQSMKRKRIGQRKESLMKTNKKKWLKSTVVVDGPLSAG
jgi:hypothetical protein